MEFIKQPQQSNLAALLAQMQARRSDPIAEGILAAAKGIGSGLQARGERRATAAEDEKKRIAAAAAGGQASIVDLLGRGTLAGPAGAPIDLAQLLPRLGLPTGTTFTPRQERGSIQITPEILVNYPQMAKMGYATGDMVPSTVFNAQTRTVKAEKAPAGFRFTAGGDLEAIAGGPAATKEKEKSEKIESARMAASAHATDVIEAASKALPLIGFTTTGVTGAVMSMKPGSARTALEGYINTLKANLSFERLQEMRENSKTGGALGAVSDIELKLLGSTAASLDPNQPNEVLKENILKVKNQYEAVRNKLQSAAPVTPTGTGAPGLTAEKSARLGVLRAKQKKGGK